MRKDFTAMLKDKANDN